MSDKIYCKNSKKMLIVNKLFINFVIYFSKCLIIQHTKYYPIH
jgi:hypothetical protein